MAKKKQETPEQEASTSNEVLSLLLKDNTDDHYNDEEPINYRVSTGSIGLDYSMNGGLGAGLHRFFGPYESGKTSEALIVMKNFLSTVSQSKGIYFKAEGRLTPEMIKRSGVPFVYNVKDWVDGTCFVMKSNIYDFVADTIRKMILYNPSKSRYGFIIDSVDGLIPRNDIGKKFSDAQKVAGGAVIASVLMKEISIPLAERGHMAIFISQVRSDIKISQYEGPARSTSGSGGNALLHFANWILNFERIYKGDWLLKNPSKDFHAEKNPAIGHMAKITVGKSPNETTNTKLSYPVRYGRSNGKSIWIEKELVDILLGWGKVTKSGAWYKFDDEFGDELKAEGLVESDHSLKFQGEDRVFKFIEGNDPLIKFLIDFFNKEIEKLLAD